jgi:hypothetical protein
VARNFLVAGSEGKYAEWDIGGMSAMANTNYTMAVVVVPVTQKSPGFWTAACYFPATVTGLFYNSGSVLHWTGGDEFDSTIPVAPSDGWCVLAFTNSTTAVTFHKYAFAVNTWTHETFGGTSAEAAPGGGAVFRFGEGDQNLATPHLFAAGGFWHRQFTQQEIERLARGNWWKTSPDFHVEFPSGGDHPTLTKDLGRYRLKMTTDTGTLRWAIRRPAGVPLLTAQP